MKFWLPSAASAFFFFLPSLNILLILFLVFLFSTETLLFIKLIKRENCCFPLEYFLHLYFSHLLCRSQGSENAKTKDHITFRLFWQYQTNCTLPHYLSLLTAIRIHWFKNYDFSQILVSCGKVSINTMLHALTRCSLLILKFLNQADFSVTKRTVDLAPSSFKLASLL